MLARGDQPSICLVGSHHPLCGGVASAAVLNVPLDEACATWAVVGLDEPALGEYAAYVVPAGCVEKQIVALGDHQPMLG